MIFVCSLTYGQSRKPLICLDNRLRFSLPTDASLESDLLSSNPSTGILLLSDFVLVHCPLGIRTIGTAHPLALLSIFDPPTTIPVTRRDEAVERRSSLKDGLTMHGFVASIDVKGKGEERLDTAGKPRLSIIVDARDCRISADRDFKW